MKYNFDRECVFMYCHKLTITDGKNTYEAIIEDSVEKAKTFLIWLEDFDIPENEVESVKYDLSQWCRTRGYKCVYFDGKRCQ